MLQIDYMEVLGMNTSQHQRRRFLCLLGITLPFTASLKLFAANKPLLKLAQKYSKTLRLKDFLVSEKYDGIRGFWTGSKFKTRSGTIISPPSWWSRGIEGLSLDGELWIGRGDFSELNGMLKQKQLSDAQWRRIQFLVFDLPSHNTIFEERHSALTGLFENLSQSHIKLVAQSPVTSDEALMIKLNEVINSGGEGLMLQRKEARYSAGRQSGLYKLKRWQDAEAIVVARTAGKGKYQGAMGALIVKIEGDLQFRIGSGFSDAERQTPPPIGSVITYRYSGKSKKGIPRFASFVRLREYQ